MTNTVWGDAEARWLAILEQRPDLEPAVALQRILIGRVLQAHSALAADHLPDVEFPPRYLALKVARGVPILHDEQLPVPHTALAPLLVPLAQDIAAGGAGEAAEHVAAALASGRIDGGSLLAASTARNQHAIRQSSSHLGLSPDVVWLVGELATSAFVHDLARSCWLSLSGHSSAAAEEKLEEMVDAALPRDGWHHGYCPTCGSWPVLVGSNGERRSLHCSYCATPWRMREHRCAYCHESADRFRILAPNPDQPDRMLEVCDACGGYLKAIFLPNAPRFPLLAIEDLATLDLDRVAMELGYHRPPLPERYPA